MSISFSGLASGLDTSSWVESLVKIKQEKVSDYEAKKKTLEATQEALASIKTFFSSFRSMLEKVTDTKFGVKSSDIFSQKLASSSNSSIVSAMASYDAEEANYDVKVDKLATKTTANSGIRTTETITSVQLATLDTQLKDLGVKSGSIDVTINNVKQTVNISSDDTISKFITKLDNIGVESKFNEKTGVFSIDIKSGLIKDNGTGVLDALGLEAKGYESANLTINTTVTVTQTATGSTKLSELGMINAGKLSVEANGVTSTINVTKDMTLNDFVAKLTALGIDASLSSDGLLKINDAIFNDIDNTNILNTLGLKQDINSKQQVAEGLAYTTVISDKETANSTTLLKDLIGGENLKDNDTVVVKTANDAVSTITLKTTDTLGDLVEKLNNAGLTAAIDNSGSFSLANGDVTGGSFDLKNVLGLTSSITTTVNANTTTKLSDFTPARSFTVMDKDGSEIETVTLDEDATIGEFFDKLSEFGITGNITNGVISLTSDDKKYIAGELVEALGIGTTDGSTVTMTIGNSITTGVELSYTSLVTGTTTTTVAKTATSASPITFTTTSVGTVYTSTYGITATSSSPVRYTIRSATSTAAVTYTTASTVSTTTTVGNTLTSSSALVYRTYSGRSLAIATTAAQLTVALSNTDVVVGIAGEDALRGLASYVNAGNDCSGRTFVLTTDINLSQEWVPIGHYSQAQSLQHVFSGTFDGNGYSIDGVNIGSTTTNKSRFGLFGAIKDATIKNVSVGVNIDRTCAAFMSAGGIVGQAIGNSTISNCNTSGKISLTFTKGNADDTNVAGGIVGTVGYINSTNYGTVKVENCSSSCTITIDNSSSSYELKADIGGIAGLINSNLKLDKCANIGECSSTSNIYSAYIGGLCGISSADVEIRDSYNSGNIKALANVTSVAGGLLGDCLCGGSVYIYTSYSSGSIIADETVTLYSYAGGLIGSGSIHGRGGVFCGKIVSGKTTHAIAYSGSMSNSYYYSQCGASSDIGTRDTRIDSSTFTNAGFSQENWRLSSTPTLMNYYMSTGSANLIALGLKGSETVIVKGTTGTVQTVTIGTTDCVCTKLTQAGLAMTIDKGVISITGGTIISMSDKLADALGLNVTKRQIPNNIDECRNIRLGQLDSKPILSERIYDETLTVTNTATGDTNLMTFTAETTVYELINFLRTSGLDCSLSDGKITLKGSDGFYMPTPYALKTLLNIDIFDYLYSITAATVSTTTTETLTSSDISSYNIRMRDLGLNDTGYITVYNSGSTETITVDASTSLASLKSTLRTYSVTMSCSDYGKISLNQGYWYKYITGISSNLQDILHISRIGETGTISATNSDDMILSNIEDDLAGTYGIIIAHHDYYDEYISVHGSDTIGDLKQKLSNIGFNMSISSDGKFIIAPTSSNNYIYDLGYYIKSLLNITAENGSTYTCANPVARTTTVTATLTASNATDVTMSKLGLTSTGTVTVKSGAQMVTISVSTSDTVSEFLEKLQNADIEATISGGKITFEGNGSTSYITAMSTNLRNILNTTVGSGYTYESKTQSGSHYETILLSSSNANETLSRFGMKSSNNGTITINNNGTIATVSVTSTMTFAQLASALNDAGITLNYLRGSDSGKLSFEGDENHYILGITEGLESFFSMEAGDGYSYSLNEYTEKSNTNSNKLSKVDSNTFNNKIYKEILTTVMANATRDTKLREYGVTAGEFYIYSNGVKHTALISDDETLGSFMSKLESFGIQTGLITNNNSAKLVLIGSGDSYIATSKNTANASNIVDKLFTSAIENKYNYTGTEQISTTTSSTNTATEDTLISDFNKNKKSEGTLVATVRGTTTTISISATETFGSLVDKLNNSGIAASFHDNKLYLSTAYDVALNKNASTSAIFDNINFVSTNTMSGFMASNTEVQETTSEVVEKVSSAFNYATLNTKLDDLNISKGKFSIFRNGIKAEIDIDPSQTLNNLRTLIKAKFSDVDLRMQDGKLEIYSTADGAKVNVGATTDTSNIRDILGLVSDSTGTFAQSSRELYCVNENTLVTAKNMFKKGTITEGNFKVGDQTITVTKTSTMQDIINQINNNEKANATAYIDDIEGKLVIQSRSTGAALINIEAGTSNFTDILGFTNAKALNINNQELGSNAKFSINGTNYYSASNTVDSSISRIKGVTLNLNDISPNNAVTITIKKDTDGLASAMQDVVDSYNELMKNINEQLASSGKLSDQTTLKLIRNQLRNMMTSSDAGTTIFRNLSAIGISVSDASGGNISTSNESIIDLSFDKDKFIEAYNKDSVAVKALLVGGDNNKGVFTKVEELLENSLKSVSGYFDSTESRIKNNIRTTESKITKANTAIERYRAQLEKKFSSMNLFISKVQQQYSSFLTT